MGEKHGKLIVISAPSGAGKTTIVERLLARNDDWKRSISYTTRLPRKNEENGRDYFFVTAEEFEEKRRSGFFLESANVFDFSYGTSREYVLKRISSGLNVVLAIDVQGMKQLLAKKDEQLPMVSFFIMPPSFEELKQRLKNRKTETQAEMKNRLKIAEEEIAQKGLYDYEIVNQDIDQAVKEIEEKIHEHTD